VESQKVLAYPFVEFLVERQMVMASQFTVASELEFKLAQLVRLMLPIALIFVFRVLQTQ
jgi:hypothetical protein